MEDKSARKAAKKIIKRAKKHPDWYSQEDVMYAKLVKKVLKKVNDVKLISVTPEAEKHIAYCARVSNPQKSRE